MFQIWCRILFLQHVGLYKNFTIIIIALSLFDIHCYSAVIVYQVYGQAEITKSLGVHFREASVLVELYEVEVEVIVVVFQYTANLPARTPDSTTASRSFSRLRK